MIKKEIKKNRKMFIVTDLASLNRINTNALIIFQRLTDPNIIPC